jgi:hypothetical protein
MVRDPAEQLLRRLHDQTALAREVASAEDRERIVRERRHHLRTVRSAAESRNRPRSHLAWLILLALILLILAATRAAAQPAPSGDDFANAMTGCAPDGDCDEGDDDDEIDDDGLGGLPESIPLDELDGRGDADRDERAAVRTALGGDADRDERAAVRAALGDDGAGPARRGDAEDELAEARAEPDDEAGDLDGPEHGEDAILVDDSDADGLVPGEELDGEPATREAIATGMMFASTAFADAAELRDLELRHQRPSRWGRLDLSVAWRRSWDVTIPNDAHDSLWVVATWRR